MNRTLLSLSLVSCASLACSGIEAPLVETRDEQHSALSAEAWVTTDVDAANVIASRLPFSARVELGGQAGSPLVALRLPRSDLSTAAEEIHHRLRRCGGFFLRDSEEEATQVRAMKPALKVEYQISNSATVAALKPKLAAANLQETIEKLAAFPTRFHESADGKKAATWIQEKWQSLAAGKPGVTIALVNHKKTPQPSVAMTIQGSKLPDELVILGGHLDSINQGGGVNASAPGADDNASGIAVLTEVARVVFESGYRPERSLLFYAYAAEEVGLVGSAEIARQAAAEKWNVAAVLQLDMTNFTSAKSPYIALVTDNTDSALNEFAKKLIDTYVDIPYRTTACGFACSDHVSWHEQGFAANHVHEASSDEHNDALHTPGDTLALTDGKAKHSLYFAQYATAFAVELARGSIEPSTMCDAARPCQNGFVCDGGVCVPNNPGTAGSHSGGAHVGGASGAPSMGGRDASGGGGSSAVAGLGGVAGMSSAGAPVVMAGNGSAPVDADPSSDSGCSCRAASGGPSTLSAAIGLVIASGMVRRRSGSRRGSGATET